MIAPPPALSIDTPPQCWSWRGYNIAYQQCGTDGPALVLIHGFGASWGHWRKNLPTLGESCRCYALDLIGFGASAKPDPQVLPYTFATWSAQVLAFCEEVVGGPAILVGNSIGGIVAMQAAVDRPDRILGVMALNFSLRLLHERHLAQGPWLKRWSTQQLQNLLGQRWFGEWFFRQIAQPRTLQNVLRQAYHQPAAVTEDLVEMILRPARDPGAAAVFLAFTRYSQGPLPEDLLPQIAAPLRILWGEADPWEPVNQGRSLCERAGVQDFRILPGVGHCPQDEAPAAVNAEILAFVQGIAGDRSQT